MRILFLTIILWSFTITLNAQSPQRAVVNLQLSDAEQVSTLKNARNIVRSEVLEIPLQKVQPFLAYAFTQNIDNEHIKLWIRFSKDNKKWDDWELVKEDTHQEKVDEKWASQLMFTSKDHRFYQYQWQIGNNELEQIENVAIHFYSPDKTVKNTSTTTNNSLESRSCPCPQPAFESRNDWCSSCPKDATPAANTVTHLIVHHSAGTNNANDWAAIVRSIWDFHVNTRGWDDIGYNWLVDPNGVLYEGRGTDLIGAHFCGMNTNTEGVCVLGDFTNITPKQAAFDKLVKLLAWKSCDRGLYPIDRVRQAASGKSFLQVSGHRDGCSTSCPGDSFYPLFDSLRIATIQYIDNQCSISDLLLAPTALKDSLFDNNTVELNWLYELPTSTIELSIERSVGENYRYEEIARVNSDVSTFLDEDIAINQLYFYRIRAVSNNEASAYSNMVEVSTMVSSQDQYFNEANVQLYPNPIHEKLSIAINNRLIGTLSIEMRDATGQLVRQLSFSKNAALFNTTIELSDLPKGLYLLTFRLGNTQMTRKISKQ